MIVLVYDTETSGLPLFKEPSEHPAQPHIVQLGAILFDLEARRRIATLDVIVRPDGWTIPAEVSDIHGITTEHALDVGIPESVAVDMLMELWGATKPEQRLRIGHNEQFDARILRIAQMRQGRAEDLCERWKAGRAECTQLLSTPILKLPPTDRMRAAGRFHHKSANLGEAYRHFTGRELSGAHSAIVDVEAALEVYLAIKHPTAEAVAA